MQVAASFLRIQYPAHASAYLSCNCSLCQTPSPRLGLPVLQLFPLPNTQPTPRLTCPATVPSAKHPAHASAYLSCNCSLCQTPSPRLGLPVLQLFPLPNTQLPAQGRLRPTAAIPTAGSLQGLLPGAPTDPGVHVKCTRFVTLWNRCPPHDWGVSR